MKTKTQFFIGILVGILLGIFCYAYIDYISSKEDIKRVVVEAPIVKPEPLDEARKISVMEKRDGHGHLIETERSWVERGRE